MPTRGIRTRSPDKRAAAEKPLTHWLFLSLLKLNQITIFQPVPVNPKAQTTARCRPADTVHNDQCSTVGNSTWHSPSQTTASTNNFSTREHWHRDCTVPGSFNSVTRILRNPELHNRVQNWPSGPSWDRLIQSTHPRHISLGYILIISLYLALGLSNVLLPLCFPHPICVWWAVQIIQLHNIRFSPIYCYFPF